MVDAKRYVWKEYLFQARIGFYKTLLKENPQDESLKGFYEFLYAEMLEKKYILNDTDERYYPEGIK